jgi:hypothetical protein
VRNRATSLAVLTFALWLCGCPQSNAPGKLVGSYHISGALTDNTCGSAALPAADHLSFDVDVREAKGAGYWVRSSPPPQGGQLDAAGNFTFELQNTYRLGGMTKEPVEALIDMDPEKLANPQVYDHLDQAQPPPCQLTVTERIKGTLLRDLRQLADGGTGPSSDAIGADDLVADNEITIRPAAGSDCKMVLAAQGGPFDALPCRAHYDLTGQLATK